MLKILVRKNIDLSYLEDDPALELDGIREGPAKWQVEPLGPLVASELREHVGRSVVGYDLVVAAPRTTSILVALDDELARRAVAAHRDAVSDALRHLASEASWVSMNIVGERERLRSPLSVVASFTHGVNRAGEPHVHDHVVVSSAAPLVNRALDSRSLFSHAASADAIYRSALREGLNARGVTAWRSLSGIDYVGAVDEGLRALWCGRANERGTKRHWTRAQALGHWDRDRTGSDLDIRVSPPRERTRFDAHVINGVLYHGSTIDRRVVLGAVANGAVFGARREEIVAFTNSVLSLEGKDRARGHGPMLPEVSRRVRELAAAWPQDHERQREISRGDQVLARSR